MQYQINEITSIPNAQIKKLKEQGITTADALLSAGRTPAARRALAKATGIQEINLFKWVNYADLSRVDGLDPELTGLLEEVGITTLLDLRGRSPFSLHSKLVSTNHEHHIVNMVPDMMKVVDMVNNAKAMEPEVAYR
ncbi:DUF4332 domain-containing protein [Hymenobacter siberiensis]|jgi:predicted RecB family nuclease|uniref:DUF4332 domain-containing protein n=1 Tax=Hymenobacter siberiensis TaxID=2848396 RepID=UPI001C1DD8DE|nr:DUF4332 domain-containing protein [Hymenobacter siberiensis]MBU6119784.1 DUF4332 domain-containing protein [Hymenobacter siberiensis]